VDIVAAGNRPNRFALDQRSAFFSVIAASVFNRSRVDRASRSSRVTITTSPAAISERRRRSERELIRSRTGEGRARAKANGQSLGRKPKLTPHQQHEAIQRRDSLGEAWADTTTAHGRLMLTVLGGLAECL
jgi:hypothetical protein